MRILEFPELRQAYEYDCGTIALQAVLIYYGIEMSEEILIKKTKTNSKIGTTLKNMQSTLKKLKLEYDSKQMTIPEIKEYIKNKIPVILLIQAWNPKIKNYKHNYHDGHWIVAIGYDKNKIIFEDPYSFERTYLTEKELKERWHSKEKKEKITNQGIAVFGKSPKYNSKKIIHMK